MTPKAHTTDEAYMRRCLELARLGAGHVAPNPMVGSVIVHQGRIVGEGYHQQYGGPHAEVHAIRSVHQPELLREACLYVNLEPCAHFGKTPPCSDLIVQMGIPRVVIGCIDTYAQVAGKGIERMRRAGIEVVVGVLETDSRELNRRFFTYHAQQRPYIILKWAQSRDGYLDYPRTDTQSPPAWITNEMARSLVHKWRTEEAAFLVGTRTAQLDNPQLNVRAWHGPAPLRITLDQDHSLPATLHLFDGSQSTLVFHAQQPTPNYPVEWAQVPFDEHLLPQMLQQLHQRGIQSLVVEGGERMLNTFIDAGLWDEARIFVGPPIFGGGTKAPILPGQPTTERWLQDSLLLYYRSGSTPA